MPRSRQMYRDLDWHDQDRDDAAFGVTLSEVPGLFGPTTGFASLGTCPAPEGGRRLSCNAVDMAANDGDAPGLTTLASARTSLGLARGVSVSPGSAVVASGGVRPHFSSESSRPAGTRDGS